MDTARAKDRPVDIARRCAVEGCDRPHRSQGWCGMHLRRLQKHGDPLHEWRPPSTLSAEQAHELLAKATPKLTPSEEYPGSANNRWFVHCDRGHELSIWIAGLQTIRAGRKYYSCRRCRIIDWQAEIVDFLATVDLRPVGNPPVAERQWSADWAVECMAGHRTIVEPSQLRVRIKRGTAAQVCGECARRAGHSSKRYTHDEAAAKLTERRITPLGPYPGSHKPWPATCPECGHQWSVKLAMVLAVNAGCPACANARHAVRRRIGEAQAVSVLTAAGLTPDGPYPGAVTLPWKLRCQAGHHFTTSTTAVGAGTGCPRCFHLRRAAGLRRDQAEAVSIMRAAGLEPLEPYRRNTLPWPSRCIAAGHRVSPRLTSVIAGSGCYVCAIAAKGRTLSFEHNSSAAAFLYLVRYLEDDGTPFLKVGVGLHSSRRHRLTQHQEAGADVLEVVHSPWQDVSTAETLLLRTFRPRWAYSPRRPGGGPWGLGAETLRDETPIRLARVFPL